MRGATPTTTTFAEVKTTTLFASFSSSSSSSTNKASSSRRSFRKKSRFGAFAFAAFRGDRNTSSSSSSGVCSDARGSIARSESYTDDRVVLSSSSSKAFLVRTKATYSNNDDEVMKKDTKKLIDYGRVGVAFAFPALAGFLFGLDIGLSSGALESIKTSSIGFLQFDCVAIGSNCLRVSFWRVDGIRGRRRRRRREVGIEERNRLGGSVVFNRRDYGSERAVG
jgi:hypothetical protein